MTVVVSILLFAAMFTVIGAVVFVIRESLRRVPAGGGRPARPTTRGRAVAQAPLFGSLPTLSDPVGPLGNPAPGADLSSDATSEREIYGE